MGTSTSSAGAGSGASFDPPWLDDAEGSIDSGHADKPISPSTAPAADPDEAATQDQEGSLHPPAETGLTVAPPEPLPPHAETGSRARWKAAAPGCSAFRMSACCPAETPG